LYDVIITFRDVKISFYYVRTTLFDVRIAMYAFFAPKPHKKGKKVAFSQKISLAIFVLGRRKNLFR